MAWCAFCHVRILHTNKDRLYDDGLGRAFCSTECMNEYNDRANRRREKARLNAQIRANQRLLEEWARSF